MTTTPTVASPEGRQHPDDFYTGTELANRYKVSIETIRKWRATGYGPDGVRFGRHVRYPRESVEQWERERQP